MLPSQARILFWQSLIITRTMFWLRYSRRDMMDVSRSEVQTLSHSLSLALASINRRMELYTNWLLHYCSCLLEMGQWWQIKEGWVFRCCLQIKIFWKSLTRWKLFCLPKFLIASNHQHVFILLRWQGVRAFIANMRQQCLQAGKIVERILQGCPKLPLCYNTKSGNQLTTYSNWKFHDLLRMPTQWIDVHYIYIKMNLWWTLPLIFRVLLKAKTQLTQLYSSKWQWKFCHMIRNLVDQNRFRKN